MLDPTVPDNTGMTPLHLAAEAGTLSRSRGYTTTKVLVRDHHHARYSSVDCNLQSVHVNKVLLILSNYGIIRKSL